jgi:hypothetical protein
MAGTVRYTSGVAAKPKSEVFLLMWDMNNLKYVYMHCKLIFWPIIIIIIIIKLNLG